MSGSTNAGEAFDLTATREAKDSTYAGIVRLVEEAQASKAPMSRLADRWSLGFLAVTVSIAFAAWWFTGDPIRTVAVLVVATPCPLIQAVPVALVAGLSRAAHFGVLIKGAGPLETMARIRTLILDKTGTLTDGRPQIVSIDSHDGMAEGDILRLAAALDQASKHPVAQAIVAAAKERGFDLPVPSDVAEIPREGLVGHVEGRKVIVGLDAFVASRVGRCPGDNSVIAAGSVLVAVAVDGHMAGHLVMSDPLREGAGAMLDGLRREGISRVLLATGDRANVAEHVTEGLGLDGLHAGLTPDQKVLLVLTARKNGPVMMVGDGVNDAPALAAADVGVAMGARGAAASAEAADVVLRVDRIDRLGPGIEIARGARRIAVESIVAGVGLSVAGMIAAAYDYLTPVQGALLQEAIDVAVILNALRALRFAPHGPGTRFGVAMGQRLDVELDLSAGTGAFPILALREGARERTGIVLAAAGAGIARISGVADAASPAFDAGLEQEGAMRAVAPLAARPASKTHAVMLGGSMKPYVWTIDGKTWGDHLPVTATSGERVEIMFHNTSMTGHPMHLHGHAFQVVGIGDRRFAGAVRDTVQVPPMAMVTIAVDAGEAARWMLHCHHMPHLATGMMTEFAVGA